MFPRSPTMMPDSLQPTRNPVDTYAPPDLETASDAYARRFSGSVGRWFLARQAEAVSGLLAEVEARSVLEVGGGHAQLTVPLEREGYRVIIQGSRLVCAERPRRVAPGSSFIVSPLDRLPFGDAAVDAVVSVRTMAHVSNPASFLIECARVARSSVIVDFPSLRSFNSVQDLLFRWKKRIEGDTRPYRCFHSDKPEQFILQQGYSERRRSPPFFWPMALHRAHGSGWIARLLEWGPGLIGLRHWAGSPVVALFQRVPA